MATALYKVKDGFSAKHRGVIYTSGAALELTPEEAELLRVQVEFVQDLPIPEPEKGPKPSRPPLASSVPKGKAKETPDAE